MKRKLLKGLVIVVGGFLILLAALMIYIQIVARVDLPRATKTGLGQRTKVSNSFFALGNNHFRKSESGLYELYVEGDPYTRGVAAGRLSKELVQYQEVVFNGQIHRLVPSDFYLEVLRYFIGWFNRDLDKSVSEEYKLEILGVSESADAQFDDIAPPYQRLLNYHAAHDIGHALQNMSLVGCTAFATWGNESDDSTLIVGRNFDFFVGEEFARDKIVAFYNPSKGYRFMMITWGGMTGVLSGMNQAGITVTINAAKSEIPSGSATPVSLVAREILQYASNIDEAFRIAKQRNMFVSESFLIGSAKDKKAVIIEKSPEETVLFDPGSTHIVCTNHFQSAILGNTPLNLEHIKTSSSPYRYKRVEELLAENKINSVSRTAGILRNQLGLGGKNIGLGNEKSINQLIAHHAVIFQPEKQLVWISTAPWQLGKFVCYDLNKVFAGKLARDEEIYEADKTISADPFLSSPLLPGFLKFSKYRFPFQSREGIQPDSLVKWNPDSYLAYLLAGDLEFKQKHFLRASHFYEKGLSTEVATTQELEHIKKNLERCRNELE